MKFKQIINESAKQFRFYNYEFTQIYIDRELNIKFRESRFSSLTDLIAMVRKIKSDKIYAFYGFHVFIQSWNVIMFIYKKNDNYKLEIYENSFSEKRIKKLFNKNFSENEFNEFIENNRKKLKFDRNIIYSNK